METAALVFFIIAAIALIDIGMISMPLALARKGYNPRPGIFFGAILGLVAALAGLFILKPILYLPLEGAQAAMGAVLDEEHDIIRAEWNDDGDRVVAWTEEDKISIWTLLQVRTPSQYAFQDDSLQHVALSPNERQFLAWGDNSNTIELWVAVDDEQPRFFMEHDGNVVGAQWVSDSESDRVLTWTDNNSVYVWNTGENLDIPLILRSDDEIISATWDESEAFVLIWYTDGTVRIWDTTDPAAGQRVSTTEDALERLPFLALEVDDNTPAEEAGLRTGDRIIRVNTTSFVVEQLISENDIDTTSASVTDINRALRPSLTERLETQFDETQADGRDSILVEVLRDGESITVDVEIPLPQRPEEIIEFSDLGFSLTYVPENPKFLVIGEFSSDTEQPPWNPERSQLLSWSENNALRVFSVEAIETPELTLPYGDRAVEGAFWGNNNAEIIFWSNDEAFAWNLEDENAANRSAEPETRTDEAGILLDVDDETIASVAGLQPGDVLISIDDVEINVAAIIEDNNIAGQTTRDFDRAVTPIVTDQLAQAVVSAGVSGTPLRLTVIRDGIPQIAELQISDTPLLFPALNIPIVSLDTLGLDLEYIGQNPRRLSIEGDVVAANVSAANDYMALLTTDSTLTLWSLQTNEAALDLTGYDQATWSPDGSYLIVWSEANDEVRVYNTESINEPEIITPSATVTAVGWAPDSETFFIKENDRTLAIWNVNDLTVEDRQIVPEAPIKGVAWSSQDDPIQIMTYLENGTLTIWSATGQEDDITVSVNSNVTFADDLGFDVAIDFDNETGILPLRFDLSGARTNTIAFLRAVAAGLITYFGGLLLIKLFQRLLPNISGGSADSLRGTDMRLSTMARGIRGRVIQIHYFVAIVVGILALSALMWNVIKGTFTLAAVQNTVDPLTLTEDNRELSELSAEELSIILGERVPPRILRTLVQDNVWGVDDTVTRELQYEPLDETSLGDLLPDGGRLDDGITFQNLDENPSAMRDLMATNVEPEILQRLAEISRTSDEDLAELLLSITTPERQLEILTEQNVWEDLTNPQVQPYDPEELAAGLNLATLPPEGLTYETLPENPEAWQEALSIERGFARGVYEDIVITELANLVDDDRFELVTLLLDSIDGERTREILIDLEILFEPEETEGYSFSPEILQERLLLDAPPAQPVPWETIGDDRALMEQAFANDELINRLLVENIVLEEIYGFETSDLREDTIRSATAPVGTPQSILNRNIANIIVNSEFHTAGRTRDIVRIYAWGADIETVREVSSEPLISASGMRNPPQVADDINFNSLSEAPDAARYILLENLNRTDMETLVIAEVVQPRVVSTWTLDELIIRELGLSNSIDEELEVINAEGRERAEVDDSLVWNDAELEFRSWLTLNFLQRTLSANAELTGMRNAILGTGLIILITILIAFPIGIGAAIYLEEYNDASNQSQLRGVVNRVIQTNIDNLAGVPSIIYGLLGVALFVRALEPITSGQVFGYGDEVTANGRTILSASLTMALLILPIIIINAQEAIRAVSDSFRRASYGLGATKWQTIWNHVLPYAMPGILTGTILAMSRAIGETAPLIVVGAATFIVQDPDGPFSKFTALPIQIYSWTGQPRDADKAVAAAAIIVLLAILLTLNSIAVYLRSYFERSVGRS